MFAEKHQDLGSMEQDLRKSLKHYRSLLRWGIDKVFGNARLIVEGLFSDVRQSLDNGDITQAGVLLDELNSKLREMEKKYPDTKSGLLANVKNLISFLDTVLTAGSDISSSHLFGEIKDESIKRLECARVSLQNDDWEQAKVIADQVFDQYISFRQDELLNSPSYLVLEAEELADVRQKLQTAFQSQLRARVLSIDELNKMFQMAESQSIATLRIAVLGDVDSLSAVFSELSKSIDFNEINERNSSSAALLRIPVSRAMTIYIAGIPIEQRLGSSQIQEYADQYSMMFLDRAYVDDADFKLHELLLSCVEQLPFECINIIGESKKEGVLSQFGPLGNICLDKLSMQNVVEGIYKSMNKALIHR